MSKIVTTFDNIQMVTDLRKIHQTSYINFVKDMLRERVQEAEENRSLTITERISEAFIGLDNDMSREAIETVDKDDDLAMLTATVAMSGAVAVLTYVEGKVLL